MNIFFENQKYIKIMNESVRVIPSGDESGILVQARFKEFLECFKGDGTKNDLRQVEDGSSQQK